MGKEPLIIDGAHGEGGGQILRTALALSAVSGRPIRIQRVRAGRPTPGLAAQHLAGLRAVAAICGAAVDGDRLGAEEVGFAPAHAPRAGAYLFDVAAARQGGSAGAATLVLQAVLLPLALARGDSTVAVRGGTHVPWSPSFDYAREVWLPMVGRMGVAAELELVDWGFYPVGQGEIRARVRGRGARALAPLEARRKGALEGVRGRAVAANLPAHIAQRMADRARALLAAAGIAAEIEALRVRAASAGAALFLGADYDGLKAGFDAHGRRGKPAEQVAEEAAEALLAHHRSGAAVDLHLADQLVLPAALAAGESAFTVEGASRHLRTCAWLVERFALARVEIEAVAGKPALVRVRTRQP
jgi:RNA 3'-terminal phosphate cyclase (ATP)